MQARKRSKPPTREATVAVPVPTSRAAGDVGATLKSLKEFYARGLHSVDGNPGRASYGSMIAVDRGGKSSEMLRKARQFADETVGYSRKEFDDLLAQCRRHEFGLGVSLIIRLLSVPKGAQRNALQRAAIEGRWSRRKLDKAIKEKFNNRRPSAGRHVSAPEDLKDAVYRINSLCDQWKNLYSAIVATPTLVLPRALGNELRKVNDAIQRLKTSVEAP
jgi:hypothetical protein